MTSVERMDLAVREEVIEVLVVGPRDEVIIATSDDLGRRGDRRQQITQHRVLLRVVPHEAGGLREAPEVIGADVVLVDFGLTGARRNRLDRIADIGSGVESAHVIETRRLDDVFERATCFDRKTDRAAADSQARDALWSLRSEEERRRSPDVWADDVRSA